MGAFKDLINQEFGWLKVVSRAPNNKWNQAEWNCLCLLCNKNVVVSSTNLVQRRTKQCRICSNTKHGMVQSREYAVWEKMCSYKKKGVFVYPEWENFQHFILSVGRSPSNQHSFRRKDGTKGYEPSNCYWAAPGDRIFCAKRGVIINHNGAIYNLASLANHLKLCEATVSYRLKQLEKEKIGIDDFFRTGYGKDKLLQTESTESKRLRNNIRTRVCVLLNQKLRKDCKVKPKGKTYTSHKIADEIIEHIGFCPGDGYELDHIIPQSYFDFENKEEIEACWDVNNLRWLPARENISRHNLLTKKEFDALTEEQMEILKKASRRIEYVDYWITISDSIKKPYTSPKLSFQYQ